MNTKSLEIRNDDVLQCDCFTENQKTKFANKTPFQHFIEADEYFAKYNYPCILAICANGIDKEPEWVEYIKKHQDRYIIELHGFDHKRYSRLNKEALYNELKRAIDKIESTFNVKVSTWYLPFGRKGKNIYGQEVCDMLGIKYDVPIGKIDMRRWFKYRHTNHVNFHYWDNEQVKYVNEYIGKYGG